MSKFVRVTTELRDVVLVKRALDELQIGYQENVEYRHGWSQTRTPVRILVEHASVRFGLRDGVDGVLEMVGDDMSMATMRGVTNRIQQRYAYHKVLQEVNAAGFDLVEERTGTDAVIRLTVRRWS